MWEKGIFLWLTSKHTRNIPFILSTTSAKLSYDTHSTEVIDSKQKYPLNTSQKNFLDDNKPIRGGVSIGKLLLLTLNEQEENVIDKIISALSNYIQLETVQVVPVPQLSFPGLEIRQNQRRVLRDGTDIYLTRLEYGTLVYLASYPGIVFSQEQIFEAVWSMDSDSCQSCVVNVIYNLRKKIEPDRKKPTYIKTVIGVGYKFDMKRSG